MKRLERDLQENGRTLQRAQAAHEAEVAAANDALVAARRDIQIRDDMLAASKECIDADEARLKDLEVRFSPLIAP